VDFVAPGEHTRAVYFYNKEQKKSFSDFLQISIIADVSSGQKKIGTQITKRGPVNVKLFFPQWSFLAENSEQRWQLNH
jgi:hypothetical protein